MCSNSTKREVLSTSGECDSDKPDKIQFQCIQDYCSAQAAYHGMSAAISIVGHIFIRRSQRILLDSYKDHFSLYLLLSYMLVIVCGWLFLLSSSSIFCGCLLLQSSVIRFTVHIFGRI